MCVIIFGTRCRVPFLCNSKVLRISLLHKKCSAGMRTLLHRYFVAYRDAKAAQNIASDILFYLLKYPTFGGR